MGVALTKVLSGDYEVVGKNSHDFDASQFDSVEKLIEELNPDIVINTVAFLGIDPCEQEPEKAFLLNTLYPKILAELSVKRNFLLVHFSTDAVFGNNEKGAFYTEEDSPCPLNLYGVTKYGGGCMVVAYFQLGAFYGPTFSAVQELCPAEVRSTVVAFYIMSLNVVGLGVGITGSGIMVDALIARGVPQPYSWPLFSFTCPSALAILCSLAAARVGKPAVATPAAT